MKYIFHCFVASFQFNKNNNEMSYNIARSCKSWTCESVLKCLTFYILTGGSAAILSGCLPNFRVIGKINTKLTFETTNLIHHGLSCIELMMLKIAWLRSQPHLPRLWVSLSSLFWWWNMEKKVVLGGSRTVDALPFILHTVKCQIEGRARI